MNDKEQDPQLQAPQEADTGKHINFRETGEQEASNRPTSDKSDNDSPTKKAWEELRRDNKGGQSEEKE